MVQGDWLIFASKIAKSPFYRAKAQTRPSGFYLGGLVFIQCIPISVIEVAFRASNLA
jgi:hypothetical protein